MPGQELMLHATESPPATPHSPANSLLHATSHIDDLTLALANFSRAPSPDPPEVLTCCCAREDCEHLKEWLAWKFKLESRLILSAELGQALLRRHEAYVRRQELAHQSREPSLLSVDPAELDDIDPRTRLELEGRVSELVRENAVLEKRLNQALLNNEVGEATHKAALQELTDVRETVSRLTAQYARSVGWDTRLAVVTQEKEDMQQERDSEAHRARMTEVRLAALKEKSSKLQLEVRRLYKELEKRRTHRLELSEEILQDARMRLEMLQQSQFGRAVVTEDSEVTKVLESLVADNEALKRDNAELQNLLVESREEYRSMQDEVEEQRANMLSRTVDTPRSRHRFKNSQSSITYIHSNPPTPSPLSSQPFFSGSSRRTGSAERRVPRPAFEPLTPETDRRPLSPTDSLTPSETKWSSFSYPQSRYPPSNDDAEADDDEDSPMSPERPRAQKQLLLLTRSRGVQTENVWTGLLAPSPAYSDRISSISPQDGQSESSSLADSQKSSAMAGIIERISALLNRLTQADALTLTNRLKRQHLHGADVAHLSRTTVDNIVNETVNLRSQYRGLLEDEKVTTTCTRKELRGLFKIFREIFVEMGQMRITLNDVILDPSIATKVRDMAMNPSKGEGGNSNNSSSGGGWMAPISKLFGAGSSSTASEASGGKSIAPPVRPLSRGVSGRPPTRLVPKLGPALSASATTVNVEFSGAGVGRAVSSSYSEGLLAAGSDTPKASSGNNMSKSVMGIFAGAPRPVDHSDPWIMIPKDSPRAMSRSRGGLKSAKSIVDLHGTATIGRTSTLRRASRFDQNRLSRNVDAVIDVHSPHSASNNDDPGEGGFHQTLLERTLRPRGLSDSSIHTTFMNHEDGDETGTSPASPDAWPDRQGVLQALSRKVHSFRFGSALAQAPTTAAQPISQPASTSRPGSGSGTPLASSPLRSRATSHEQSMEEPSASVPIIRASSPGFKGLLPNLQSWGTSALDFDPLGEAASSAASGIYYVGSPRREEENSVLWRRDTQGRDFV